MHINDCVLSTSRFFEVIIHRQDEEIVLIRVSIYMMQLYWILPPKVLRMINKAFSWPTQWAPRDMAHLSKVTRWCVDKYPALLAAEQTQDPLSWTASAPKSYVYQ